MRGWGEETQGHCLLLIIPMQLALCVIACLQATPVWWEGSLLIRVPWHRLSPVKWLYLAWGSITFHLRINSSHESNRGRWPFWERAQLRLQESRSQPVTEIGSSRNCAPGPSGTASLWACSHGCNSSDLKRCLRHPHRVLCIPSLISDDYHGTADLPIPYYHPQQSVVLCGQKPHFNAGISVCGSGGGKVRGEKKKLKSHFCNLLSKKLFWWFSYEAIAVNFHNCSNEINF